MAADRIIIFAKRPAAGRVKTRLTPPLPPDEAAAVYEACLHDVIAHAARQRARVELWYDDAAGAHDFFAAELPHLRARPQAAGDLGARMRDAFARSFTDGAERVVLVGTDVPTLPDDILNAAFDDLHEADVAIGPCVDGGYYLIGVRATAWNAAQRLFDDVAWSGSDVFKSTIERVARLSLSSRILPGWYDVDTIADLRQALMDATPESHLGRWAARPEAALFLNAD